MKSKYQNYFKSVFSNFSYFSKIISREIRENNYFEFLEKFSRRTQSRYYPPQQQPGYYPPPQQQQQPGYYPPNQNYRPPKQPGNNNMAAGVAAGVLGGIVLGAAIEGRVCPFIEK
jgi:hypothetical protein